MGQSISPPSSRKTHSNNRYGTRSLQRSHRSSVNLQRQASLSPSRISAQNIDQISNNFDQETTRLEPLQRVGERLSKKQISTLKRDNHIGVNRQNLRGDQSVYSPNFKQLAECDQDYCLSEWRMPVQSKRIQKSNSESHHEITISFSKTKNLNSNHIHEETIVSKENLFKILEDQEYSQVEQQKDVNAINSTQLAAYINYPKENSLLEGYKNKYTQEKDVITCNNVNKKQKVQQCSRQLMNKQIISQDKVDQSSKKQLENNQISNIKEFNDYDLRQQSKVIDGPYKRKLKLSRRLLEVKEKIITVGNTSELKSQFLKSSSLHNISKSFRSIRECNGTISEDKKIKDNYEQKRSDIQIESLINKEESAKNNKVKNGDKKQQNLKILTEKQKNNSIKSANLIIFNGNDAYCYPNASSKTCKDTKPLQSEKKLSHSHGTQSSISELIKKSKIEFEQNGLTSSKELRQSQDLKKDFNKKDSKIYRPTVGEEYDLINFKSPRKSKITSRKVENKVNYKIQPQKQINEQRPMFINCPNMSPGKNIDSRLFHKPRIKDGESKGFISGLKKRYKSSESKSMLKMKLLIF